jgi:hypothetical protein
MRYEVLLPAIAHQISPLAEAYIPRPPDGFEPFVDESAA